MKWLPLSGPVCNGRAAGVEHPRLLSPRSHKDNDQPLTESMAVEPAKTPGRETCGYALRSQPARPDSSTALDPCQPVSRGRAVPELRPHAWGIGLGRTGTNSLCDAFYLLGYSSVYHNPSFDQMLIADAASDNGCVLYYKFLDFKYPGSKFILTLRDIGSWLESMRFIHSTMEPVSRDNHLPILRRMLIYETVGFDQDRFVEAYARHHDDVRRYFRNRTEDLLEMNIIDGDGWAELCSFLGLPIPDVPFPRSNTKSDWKKMGGVGPANLRGTDSRFADLENKRIRPDGSRPEPV